MSRRTDHDLMEMIRQKSSMSQQISAKDQDYGLYSGADLMTALSMVKLDTILELNIFPKPYDLILKFYRVFLDKKRKSFFASTSSELTKLGFILGIKDVKLKTKKIKPPNDK